MFTARPIKYIKVKGTQHQDQPLRPWKELELWCPESFEETLKRTSEDQRNSTERDELMTADLGATLLDFPSLLQQVRDFEQPLTLSQDTDVQAFICKREEEVSDLTSQISEMINTISRLGRQLTQTSCQLVKTSREISAARLLYVRNERLPRDILEEIFLQALSLEDEWDPRPSTPLLVSAVCYRWRQIACSLPTLWDKVYLTTTSESLIQTAKLWLSRSHHPCVILTVKPNSEDPFLSGKESPKFSFMLEAVKRFRKLEFRGIGACHARQLIPHLVQADSMNLEELILHYSHGLSEITAPNLKMLFLQSLPTSWTSSPAPKSLTVLCITDVINPTILRFLLFHLPNLHRLFIAVSARALTAPLQIPTHPMTHRHLGYLGINDITEGDKHGSINQNLLDGVIFPNLYILEYRALESRAHSPLLWLCSHSLLRKLRRFTYQTDFLGPSRETLIDLLSRMMLLEELGIALGDGPGIYPVMDILASIPRLSKEGSATAIVPFLRHISFSVPASPTLMIFSSLSQLDNSLGRLIHAWSSSASPSTIPGDIDTPPPAHTLICLQLNLLQSNLSSYHKSGLVDDLMRMAGASRHIFRIVEEDSSDMRPEMIPKAFEFSPWPWKRQYYVRGVTGSRNLTSDSLYAIR